MLSLLAQEIWGLWACIQGKPMIMGYFLVTVNRNEMMQDADLEHEGIGAVSYGSSSYGTSIKSLDMKRILKGRTLMLSFSARVL